MALICFPIEKVSNLLNLRQLDNKQRVYRQQLCGDGNRIVFKLSIFPFVRQQWDSFGQYGKWHMPDHSEMETWWWRETIC